MSKELSVGERIRAAAEYIREKFPQKIRIGAVLGSGLGYLAYQLPEKKVEIPYSEIPGYPRPSVPGHRGVFSISEIEGVNVAVLSGRIHYYEGYSPQEVILPVRILKELGAEVYIATNAAGGINKNFKPGDLMLIEDHINFMGFNPLNGPEALEWGPRFPDMTEAYDVELRNIAKEEAEKLQIKLHSGVYLGNQGPSYETPAEIRMFAGWGADAVGMSTVPEIIAAKQMNMKTLAISCISNPAAGLSTAPLKHEDVTEVVELSKDKFSKLLLAILRRLAKELKE